MILLNIFITLSTLGVLASLRKHLWLTTIKLLYLIVIINLASLVLLVMRYDLRNIHLCRNLQNSCMVKLTYSVELWSLPEWFSWSSALPVSLKSSSESSFIQLSSLIKSMSSYQLSGMKYRSTILWGFLSGFHTQRVNCAFFYYTFSGDIS